MKHFQWKAPLLSALQMQVAAVPRDMPQASRQGEPVLLSRHTAPGAPSAAETGMQGLCHPRERELGTWWQPPAQAVGHLCPDEQGRAECKERGRGCLLCTHKQSSHSLAARLLGEQKLHTELTLRSCALFTPECGGELQKDLRQQAGRLEVGRWEDCDGNKQLEIQEGMDDWQKWWLQFNKQIPQLQSGKYHRKHTTSEKAIKHPSSIQLNSHSSKLIIILGLLVLWFKDSGFPGPFYVRKKGNKTSGSKLTKCNYSTQITWTEFFTVPGSQLGMDLLLALNLSDSNVHLNMYLPFFSSWKSNSLSWRYANHWQNWSMLFKCSTCLNISCSLLVLSMHWCSWAHSSLLGVIRSQTLNRRMLRLWTQPCILQESCLFLGNWKNNLSQLM